MDVGEVLDVVEECVRRCVGGVGLRRGAEWRILCEELRKGTQKRRRKNEEEYSTCR